MSAAGWRARVFGDIHGWEWLTLAIALPFMAGLLWHRGVALWELLSAAVGCLARGVNC